MPATATDPATQFKSVPANALRFQVSEFEWGANSGDAKTVPVPVKMVARTGQPIDHWFWGRVVHDLSGFTAKPTIPIDYNHEAEEVLGYLNKFQTDTGDLVVSGAVVPFAPEDRASEVIFKAQQGVPYEASINFCGDDLLIEELGDGMVAQVNGYQLTGPAVIIRKWTLRGVAITPYGADDGTSTQLSQDKDGGMRANVRVLKGSESNSSDGTEKKMSDTPAPAADAPNNPPAAGEADKPAEGEQAKPEGTPAPTPTPEAGAASQGDAPGKQFMQTFGEQQGALYFAKGLSIEQAMREHIKVQAAEIAQLKATKPKSQADRGLESPVVFADGEPGKGAKTMKFSSMFKIAGKA